VTRHPDRSREDRARGAARRQGLRLVKSRRRDPASPDYGRYALSDDEDHLVFTGNDREVLFSATLPEIELWLRSGAWPRLRRERESAMATRMSRGMQAKPAGNPSPDPSRLSRSPSPDPSRPPGTRPEGRPEAGLHFPETDPGWGDLPGMTLVASHPDDDDPGDIWAR
jgi:hypothetical protein